jgi:hypothetical protein
LIGRKNAIKSCDKKGRKTTEASIRKAENDNLTQLFKTFPLFGTWPQVLKRILLVSIALFEKRKLFSITNGNLFTGEKKYNGT